MIMMITIGCTDGLTNVVYVSIGSSEYFYNCMQYFFFFLSSEINNFSAIPFFMDSRIRSNGSLLFLFSEIERSVFLFNKASNA